LNRFSDALPLLYQSLKVKETAFATKWIGQILLEEGKQKEALPYLEKSYNMNSEDPQLLWYLYRVYLLNSQREKAQQTLNKLRMIMPNHSGS
jgi:tetratricopeptide (TPR) repeat protein